MVANCFENKYTSSPKQLPFILCIYLIIDPTCDCYYNFFFFLIDTHGLTHKIPEPLPPGDVLLHAGDFSNTGLPREVEKFIAFLNEQPHPKKVGPSLYVVYSLLRDTVVYFGS